MKRIALFMTAALLCCLGCYITDYPVITDTEGDDQDFIVNTNGKALIVYDPMSRVIVLWPDQNEELFTMVDQKSHGDQTLYTHMNASYGESKFMDHLYCNPDWTGCPFYISDNPNSPDDDPWDLRLKNVQCDGQYSACMSMSYQTRLGECGRTFAQRAGLEALADWAAAAISRPDGSYDLLADRKSLRITGIDPAGHRRELPVYGTHRVRYVPGEGMIVRYAPSVRPTALNAVRMSQDLGITRWEVSYLGHTLDFDAKVSEQLAARVGSY